MLNHLFYYYPRGEHRSKTARHTVFRFQQNPNLCESYTEFYNMRRQSSHLRNNLHNVRKAMHRERGIDREWMEQRKMSAQKTESYTYDPTCSRLGSIPTKGVLADASPKTKTGKEWEELLRNTTEHEMKTELGRGKKPRKQAQYSFERHVQVYAEEDEVDSDPYCSAHSSSSSDSDASLSCTPPFICCCRSPKNLERRCQPQRKEA
jgi:hypothetical protein